MVACLHLQLHHVCAWPRLPQEHASLGALLACHTNLGTKRLGHERKEQTRPYLRTPCLHHLWPILPQRCVPQKQQSLSWYYTGKQYNASLSRAPLPVTRTEVTGRFPWTQVGDLMCVKEDPVDPASLHNNVL
jgi:hypothetical protein